MFPLVVSQQYTEHLQLTDADHDFSTVNATSSKYTCLINNISLVRLKANECSSPKLVNTHLHFLFLNVCGFSAKKRFPEPNDVISEIDIACLLKTKLVVLDQVDLAGFTCFVKNRKGFR